MSGVIEFPTKLEPPINNIIEREGYLSYEVLHKKVLSGGNNYLGELYEVDVKGKTSVGDKETNLFLKVMNENVDSEWMSVGEMYQTEWFAYKELFEIYKEMQEDANVPLLERYKVAKFYEGSSGDLIIMENIAKKGYKTHDRFEVVSLEFAEMTIKKLAKFHALSFALQDKRPDYFKENLIKKKYPITLKYYRAFAQGTLRITMRYIDDDIKSRVESVYYKLLDEYSHFFEDAATRRCIIHGDYRSSNMMVKINNGKVADLIAVDYQFVYFGCPVIDIIYFIFINTDRQFRKAHLSHLKNLYHETLTTFLGYFNIEVDLVYSRETFEQDFKDKLDYGMLIGFTLLPLLMVSEDDGLVLAQDVTGLDFQVSNKFRERQREIIEEFIEWGYIERN